jgi:ketosteroid isomerase-like protein
VDSRSGQSRARGAIAGLMWACLWLAAGACTPAPDLAAERMALRQADSLFAVETEARGADGWAAFFVASGVMYPGQGRVDGREAIREFMAPALAPGQPRLLWRTTDVRVGAGGDLGYTQGRWQSVGTTTTGADTVLNEGHYVTIWQKTADGAWRVAVDIGNTDAAKAAAAGP